MLFLWTFQWFYHQNSFVAHGNNLTVVGLAPSKTICFRGLEFTVDLFSHLSLSHKGGYSGPVFIGTVHSGSPSLHTTLKDSSDEGDPVSGKGGSFGSPGPQGCNVVTPTSLIITTPVPENTLVLLSILSVPVWTAAPQPGMKLLPD
jgi:hypothetical protein